VVVAPERQEPQGASAEEQQLLQNNDHDNDQREEENNEEEEEEEGNKAEGEEDEDYTPWSNVEKDETFHDIDEIKTFGDEAPIPTIRLWDLLNRINITTLSEFKIKRILRPGREEDKAIVEIISGPNVLYRHKGPAFRAICHRGRKTSSWFLGSRPMFPGCLRCITRMCLWR
jgi:hypothetical protein